MGPERKRLNAYLREVREVPFQWGKHDCFTFTNTAWKEAYGEGYADDWIGKYMHGSKPVGAKTLKKRFEFDSLEGALDSRLIRIDYTPPYGSLVTCEEATPYATGAMLGISCGVKAAFVGESGLVFKPIDTIKGAWVCHRQ